MVFFNYALRKLNAKIVYYGPGLCGKTTNLTWIHENFEGSGRGKMLSLATEGDRTIFFDLLPLDIGAVRGMDVTLQLYTVPGQVHYNATRQMVLKGADGVVFVADSQRAMVTSNIQSWNNLKQNLLLQGIELAGFPHVLQFNKRDLADIVSVEELDDALNEYDAPIFESVATMGIGVQETLEGIIKLVMRTLRSRYEAEASEERGFTFAASAGPGPSGGSGPVRPADIHPFPGASAGPSPSSPETDAGGPWPPRREEREPDAVTRPVVEEPSESESQGLAEATLEATFAEPAPEMPAGEERLSGASGSQAAGVVSTASRAEAPLGDDAEPLHGAEPSPGQGRAGSILSGQGGERVAAPAEEPPDVFADTNGTRETGTVPFEPAETPSPFEVPEPMKQPIWIAEEREGAVFTAESQPEDVSVPGVDAADDFMTQNIPAPNISELETGIGHENALETPSHAGPFAEGADEAPVESETPVLQPVSVAVAGAQPAETVETPPAEPGIVQPPEPVVFGSGDPFVLPGVEPAVSASASAVVQLSSPTGVAAAAGDIEPTANQLHVTLEGTQALARSGDVRELDITVPVPGGWIGQRRVTLQLRLTLVPADEEET